jgi:hypothetical protein
MWIRKATIEMSQISNNDLERQCYMVCMILHYVYVDIDHDHQLD